MDRVEIINLFDVYETLLTDREKEIFKYYYYEDLSLSEISENLIEEQDIETIKSKLKKII